MSIWNALEHIMQAAMHVSDARGMSEAQAQAERPQRAKPKKKLQIAGFDGAEPKKKCCDGRRIRLMKNGSEE